jgi:phage-related protein
MRALNTGSSTWHGSRRAFYVLLAFEKRTRKTPKRDIEQARNRYRDLLKARREEEHEKT